MRERLSSKDMRSAAVLLLLAVGCRASETPPAPQRAPAPERAAAPSSATAPAELALGADAAPPEVAKVPVAEPPPPYPWGATASDRLDARFPPPDGFARVRLEEGTFGAFLRTLPLLPGDAKVVDYRGNALYDDGRHANISAVVDIDVGSRDLQQCADAVVRMHAEWRYARGDRDVTYRAASGTPLSYRRWLAGDRAALDKGTLGVTRAAGPGKDAHGTYRAWLDEVFAWTNTAALERDAARVAFADLAPGDFFVMSGSPFGHAVLVLDLAKDASGRLAMLLGQSFMPAQSFHVLRPSRDATWFVVEPDAKEVVTPFWAPFPASALRRRP